MDRTRSVAFFSVGSNVGDHGAWAVRAAMNQGDLDSWILAGSYAARAGVPHRYEAGMSYSLQRYQGGNTRRARGGARHGAQRRCRVRLRRVGASRSA